MELSGIVRNLNELNYCQDHKSLNRLSDEGADVVNQFRPDKFLIVYGSLMPGKSNHHEISDISGNWINGTIKGSLVEIGWGANLGYPGLQWDPRGDTINAAILESDELDNHWARLDAFEGDEYKRMVIPFSTSLGIGLGQVYALVDSH